MTAIYKPAKDSPVSSGMEVVWRNVNVKKDNKLVLKNVSGVARPGHLLAVLGPMGSGKTTLLNALMGRNLYQTGEITLNGQPFNKQIKRKLSYVLKEEVFYPNVTLRETLRFAAMLRLPNAIDVKQKLARMEQIIDVLDIRGCLDTVMGDYKTPGLTDGQRKRASIACELITNPLMLAVDEPTSDLDSYTSIALIKTLKAYTHKSNKTVVMTIHQPSSQIFNMFDKILLLNQGQVVYFGESNKVISFFENIGLHMEPNYNPADFICESFLQEICLFLQNIYCQSQKLKFMSNFNHSNLKLQNFWTSSFLEYPELFVDKDKWPTSFFTQFKHLTVRAFWQCKSRVFSKMKIVETVLLCVLVSLVWFQLPRTEETLRDRMGAIFFLITLWGVIPLIDAITAFATERPVIDKERTANWYRLSAYYMAKMTAEIPLVLVPPVLFLILAYWIIGLNNVEGFFGMIFTTIINVITGQSIGLFLGIAFTHVETGISVSVIVMTACMLLGGFFTRNLPFWLDWIKYFSFIFYSFHCAVVLEFSSDADDVK
ncbi:hypothetical protein LOTGIDRAFT_135690 [Lottia gigantea]|uniref:ABC transporter domain-containing protein n=1 Tax=Lottia gigantea TaxID=225164 RepID=V4BFN6_LOTGI|nr:hypothetical protein LOTGIDRAFT_135690 [Lottia gigantea]ESP04687.1 hypothetical protein LOTGIDRAFT_135690 [Lottia gigantea]